MRNDYLFAGAVLVGMGILQLWFNGFWPFKKPHNMPARSAASIWGNWTRVVGYVAVVAGAAAIVLAFVLSG